MKHRGLWWIAAGVIALGLYGFVATFQLDPHFGRILAAYGGVFVAGSLAWGVIVDKFRPDRYDIIGATICLTRRRCHHVRPTTLKRIPAFAESPSHRQTQLRTLEHGQPGATDLSKVDELVACGATVVRPAWADCGGVYVAKSKTFIASGADTSTLTASWSQKPVQADNQISATKRARTSTASADTCSTSPSGRPKTSDRAGLLITRCLTILLTSSAWEGIGCVGSR